MRSILAFAALVISTSIYAAESPTNLAGRYSCSGTEVGSNDPFTCSTELKNTGQTYSLQSTCDDGSSYIGTGFYDHARHIFSLVFTNPKKSEETGVIAASVNKNHSMTSTWTYINKTSVSHGACKKLS